MGAGATEARPVVKTLLRLQSALSLLLPPAFRRRYGNEMHRMLAARHREIVNAGRRARFSFWIREIVDMLATAAREWGRGLRLPMSFKASARTHGRLPRGASQKLSLPERMQKMFVTLRADLRFALRTLAKRPVFTAMIVLTLGVGIGGTTAVFALVDSVLLTPLPFDDADRLVFGYGSFPLNDTASVSPPDYLDYRGSATSFAGLDAFTSYTQGVAVTDEGSPERVVARRASAGLFRTLGIEPTIGRGFTNDETRAGGPQVALIGNGLWLRRYGSNPRIVGREVQLDGETTRIVGVLPGDLGLFGPVDVWMPLRFGEEDMTVRRFHFLRVVGRLRDGVEQAAAQRELDGIAAQLEAAFPESNTGWRLRLVPLHEVAVGFARQPLMFLLFAVAGVLLIGCCNVATLLLARSTQRAPEIALRNALGASAGRLTRLVLTESILLASAGGALGMLIAERAVSALVGVAGSGLPRTDEIAIDVSVMLFAAAVTVGTGVSFGLVPALRASRRSPAEALKGHARGGTVGSARTRSALVIGQVTVSFALLAGAGLMVRSFVALQQVEAGFAAAELVTASVELPLDRYPDESQGRDFFTRLFDRLESMSAVDRAAGIDIVPLAGGNDTYAYREGEPPEVGSQGFNAQNRRVTPGYFEAMGIPLLRGRTFTTSDDASSVSTVILDQPFADEIFPEQDPLGRRLVVDLGEQVVAEVVGIVGGVLHFGPAAGYEGTMYFPTGQRAASQLAVVVRASGEPAAAIAALRAAVAEVDPAIPLADVRLMDEMLDATVAQPRFRTLLVGLFAAVALLQAAAGLYGVLAYSVAEGRREMGIRVAMGADTGRVVRLIIGRGLKLVVTGMSTGVVAALALGRGIQSLLFGVEPLDPLSFGSVAMVLAVVALLACAVPAYRATRLDPLEVMRAE